MTTHRYGEHPDQFCELTGDGGAAAVLLHGGFWRARYRLDLMRPMADDLAARGWTVCNVEYRRVGAGGGYPATLDDVAAACSMAREAGLDPLIGLGHSAGGHLALWLAGEGLLDGAIALGAVCCLEDAARERLGDGAADAFMGGAAWAAADPLARVPTGIPTVLVHGERDDTVPVEQARRYAAAARAAGDDCGLVEYAGGHFEVIEPGSVAWPAITSALDGLRAG